MIGNRNLGVFAYSCWAGGASWEDGSLLRKKSHRERLSGFGSPVPLKNVSNFW